MALASPDSLTLSLASHLSLPPPPPLALHPQQSACSWRGTCLGPRVASHFSHHPRRSAPMSLRRSLGSFSLPLISSLKQRELSAFPGRRVLIFSTGDAASSFSLSRVRRLAHEGRLREGEREALADSWQQSSALDWVGCVFIFCCFATN